MKDNIIKSSLTELIGTLALVYFGCATIVVNEATNGVIGHLGVSYSWGLVVLTVIFAIGHVSGGHINPAVTIAFACAGKFPWRKAIPYIVGQTIGAILGAALLKATLSTTGSVGITVPSVSVGQAFVLEMIMTGFLMFVAMSVATDARASTMLAAVAIGGAIAINVVVGGAATGASMNPARTIGPAIVSMQFGYLWLYILAPIIGAILGGSLYVWLAAHNRQ